MQFLEKERERERESAHFIKLGAEAVALLISRTLNALIQ